ncbi:MAG: hypothetical protein K2K10_02135, partial [Acetatifactor sp.]|nr:hypothetical protein [Acetatifactor sp.]
MNKMWKRALAFLLVVALELSAVNVPVVYAQEKAESGSKYLETNKAATVTKVQTEDTVTAEGTTAGSDADKSTVETENGGWDQVTTKKVFEGENYKVTFA